ncbi:MAG: hypothetical protein J6T10_21770 [Methanobrevibacter sp.]|nr:hypothetical protein [Methanobrevibacter sp.]
MITKMIDAIFTSALGFDAHRDMECSDKKERFFLKIPTKLTSLFRRKYNKNTLKIVPEFKKNNIFYHYAKVELSEHNPGYFDLMDFDEDGNLVDNFCPFFVESGKNTVICFQLVNKGKDRTEDGYIKGTVASEVMKKFVEIRNEVEKREKIKRGKGKE